VAQLNCLKGWGGPGLYKMSWTIIGQNSDFLKMSSEQIGAQLGQKVGTTMPKPQNEFANPDRCFDFTEQCKSDKGASWTLHTQNRPGKTALIKSFSCVKAPVATSPTGTAPASFAAPAAGSSTSGQP